MRIVLAATLLAGVAAAQVSVIDELVVVQDPNGAITNPVTNSVGGAEQFCQAAYNASRRLLADDYDGVFAFSTSNAWTGFNSAWMGIPVRSPASGIGRADAMTVAAYDSQRLSQCVFMGTLGTTSNIGEPPSEPLPSDPDGEWAPAFGLLPDLKSLTGIEMLGHEYGHQWLLNVEFDTLDGRGRQAYLRGTGVDPLTGRAGRNQHYSQLADSRSVMYGECITRLGGGRHLLSGCARKYSQLDQYLMGLRPPSEVSPMLVLEDPDNPGMGVDGAGLSRTTQVTKTGLIEHFVTADDVVRVMAPRVPAFPEAARCWRVAFVVVLAPGEATLSPELKAKVQRYRERWGPWFSFATDGRGAMETRLGAGHACEAPVLDGGTDAGMAEDGGVGIDGGTLLEDGGVDPCPRCDTGKLKPACGCGTGSDLVLCGLLTLGGLRKRRRAG